MAAPAGRAKKLYWCSTEDHAEDWFVVAGSAVEARRFHEEAEGYERGDATAEVVCCVPNALGGTKTGWPSDDLLRLCGAEIVSRSAGGIRVVRFGDRLYGEGDLVEQAAVAMGIAPRH